MNQLKTLNDFATNNYPNAGDIKYNTASTPTYTYDAIGNTTRDAVSGQDSLAWNLYNKLTFATANHDSNRLLFRYDGAGNRIAKDVLSNHGYALRSDYYVRDAQGNILAIYHADKQFRTDSSLKTKSFALAEHDLYGSSRLGVKDYWKGQIGESHDFNTGDTTNNLSIRVPWYSLEYQDDIIKDSLNLYGNADNNRYLTQHITGLKQYELSDHLGDVLATVSDARRADTGSVMDTISSYAPVVQSATDYYPYGMQMPGRTSLDTNTHFASVTQTVTVPVWSSRYLAWSLTAGADGPFLINPPMPPPATMTWTGVAVRLTCPPLAPPLFSINYTLDTVYNGTSQTVTINVSGLSGGGLIPFTPFFAKVVQGGTHIIGAGIVIPTPGIFTVPFTPTAGWGTVQLVVSPVNPGPNWIDIKGIWVQRFAYLPEVMVTNICSEDAYQYGYNGQMKVNEWAGVGNHMTAEFWEYDTRTGRRLNRDPKPDPSISDYAAFRNNPIFFRDVKGDTPTVHSDWKKDLDKLDQVMQNGCNGKFDPARNGAMSCLAALASNLSAMYGIDISKFTTNGNFNDALGAVDDAGYLGSQEVAQPTYKGKKVNSGDDMEKFRARKFNTGIVDNLMNQLEGNEGVYAFGVGLAQGYHSSIVLAYNGDYKLGDGNSVYTAKFGKPVFVFIEDNGGSRVFTAKELEAKMKEYYIGAAGYYSGNREVGGRKVNNNTPKNMGAIIYNLNRTK